MKKIKILSPVVGFCESSFSDIKTVYGRLVYNDKSTEEPNFNYSVHNSVTGKNDYCYDIQKITEEQLIEYIKLERSRGV